MTKRTYWPRVSLRFVVFIAPTICAAITWVLVALTHDMRSDAEHESRTLASIAFLESCGARVTFYEYARGFPRSVLIGKHFHVVTHVSFTRPMAGRTEFPRDPAIVGALEAIPNLFVLDVSNTTFSNADLRGMTSCRLLGIEARDTLLDDVAIPSDDAMHELQQVDFSGTAIGDQMMDWILRRQSINRVSVVGTRMTDRSVPAVMERKLYLLDVRGTLVSSENTHFLRSHADITIFKCNTSE